jgi:adhesin transport system membrane fusion protein
MTTGGWDDDLYKGEVGAEAETGLGRYIPHILLSAIMIFFIIFISWAYVAGLDEVTRGEAKIIPSSQIQKVQNLEGGIVAAINVREGDIVEKDQVLLRIENVNAAAKLRESRGKYLSLLATIARLEAESNGASDIQFPEEVVTEDPESANDELRLFTARKTSLEDQVNLLRDQATQKGQELAEQQGRIRQLDEAYNLKKQELDLLSPLVQQGVTPRLDLIRVQQQMQDLRMEAEATKLSVPRTEVALRESRRRVDEKITAFRAEAQQELNRKKAEVNAVAQTLTAEADKVTRTEVRSPVKGTVNKVLISTIGGVIQPGQDLMEIVPLDDKLIVEAKIRPSDRAALRPGLQAVVKVTAYDFSIHGGLPATLFDISADTIVDEQGESFYRIRLRTDQNNLGPDKPIIPGMTATVDILTGQKTVLDYLMKPILKARQNALRER